MKFAVFFFLCFVALAAAAPQLIYPGVVGGISPLGLVGPRTLVAGPTVVNGLSPWGLGGRLIAPGYVGPAII